MRKTRKKTTLINTLAQNAQEFRHQRKMKRLDSEETKRKKAELYTERYKAKQRRKSKAASTKTIARSSAVAASTGSQAAAQAEESKSKSAIARYDALISGNINGTNAIDPTKDGSVPVSGNKATNVWEGW